MKKRIVWTVFACAAAALIMILAFARKERSHEPINPDNADHFGVLLCDLVYAYETPREKDQETIAADLQAIRMVDQKDYELARAIADHWQSIYLDPDYRLFYFREDGMDPDLSEAGIPNSSRHAIVVLGYELLNGDMQPELMGRCDAAAALAKAYPETLLVCSGGATGANNPEKHTEAGLMKDYLVQTCGIEENRIYIDERAMTTAENAVNTLEILRGNGVRSMTIVTSGYHQRWGQSLYNLMAELYRQQHGYQVEIVGNYCYDTEPSDPVFSLDDRIAVRQMAGILGLPKDVLRSLPSMQASPPTEDNARNDEKQIRPSA